MNIELHVDTLVLRGIGRGQEQAIRAAMERELTRLLESHLATGSLQQQRAQYRLDAGAISVKPTANAESIGVQLAGSVYRGLSR